MQDPKKEHLVLYTGFVLIMIVFSITVFRAFGVKKNDIAASEKQQAQDDSKLANYQTISTANLQKKMLLAKNNSAFILLDIRDFNSYISEHIMDSVNMPLNEFPASQKLDTHQQVVVVAQNNNDPDLAKAVNDLQDENFSDILVLAGGIDGWKQLLGPTIHYGDPTSFVDQSKVSYFNAQDLKTALEQHQLVFIVDIRSESEFKKGHIAGAVNIPMDRLEKDRSKITQRKVVVVGDSELEEFQAGVQINDMLLISPFVMRGAMPGWEKQNFPLVQN